MASLLLPKNRLKIKKKNVDQRNEIWEVISFLTMCHISQIGQDGFCPRDL